MLTLGDLSGLNTAQIRKYIIDEFLVDKLELKGVKLLIAASEEGSYEGSNWFLFTKEGKLYENHGGHCSCYGFEDQWRPEETTWEYLLSDKFVLWFVDDKKFLKQKIKGMASRAFKKKK